MENHSPELAALTQAAAELRWPSENDYPVEVFRLFGPPPDSEQLLALLGMPSDTPTEELSVEQAFASVTKTYKWYDEEQLALAERFTQLRETILAELREPSALRAGEIEVTLVIVGRDQNDDTVGIRTLLIET